MGKVAVITGVTGQDGSYLAKFLLEKGYEVHGLKRPLSLRNTQRIDDIYEDPLLKKTNFFLHYGDLTDPLSLINLVARTRPDELYNLAAQSHVAISFNEPEYTGNADGLGTLRLLEAIRISKLEDKTKFYQASTSELFGDTEIIPQSETTLMSPQSPYAIAKLYSYWVTKLYRKAYGIFASNGILFNHESPFRGENFVTRKITTGVAEIFYGKRKILFLGNIYARRDWGHALDYVRAQWLILQHHIPDDFVIATGNQYSVKDFVEICFDKVGITISWVGTGLDEVAVVKSMDKCIFGLPNVKKGQKVIAISLDYLRPSEVDNLLGDSSKAKNELGWQPEISFEKLVEEMIVNDMKIVKSRANF